MAGRLKLGQLLVAQGLIHPDQLAAALAAQEEGSARVGMALVQMGALEEEELITVLARQLGVKVARLGGKTVSAEILGLVPTEVAEKRRCLPLFLRDDESGEGELLVVGMEDPSDEDALAEITKHARCRPHPVLIGPTELDAALQRYYGKRDPDAARDPLEDGEALPPLGVAPAPEPEAEEPDAAAPLPPSEWMESTDDTQPDLGEDLFSPEDEMDLGALPDLDETLDPLDDPSLDLSGSTLDEGDEVTDEAEASGDPLLGLDFEEEAAGSGAEEDELLAALDASFSAALPPTAADAPASDLAFADPDASWSAPAQDPSVAEDPLAGEDPFADFEKEPFAEDDASAADDSPTDPVAGGVPAAPAASREEVARQTAILQALAQLLVEKGVIGREEFAARLRKLTHS